MCVCSLSYPARNAHAPYYIVIRGLSGSTIFFSTLSHKQHEFRRGKNVIERNKVWVSICPTILWEFSLILRIIERDVTNVHMSSYIYVCTRHQWRTEGGLGGFKLPPSPKFRSFDKVETYCKLNAKCLVFLFHLPN